ncbi:MAG: simple sugar transport system substrate-binding protein [Candidatus Atribacteria bacterium]|uniref:Substrate-binding domain-containing protein n=1 Tax=Thermatribacter velox TaxID=3039681 RepID=A0ABZ2YD16_9BACT|nr:simple sugar transport system substrate-binding protein [Candidatus Atribacteria bacterium]MDI3530678.1 simple sugar transport system substrate-binding protein [Candidatus Atribacteria bacterium]
MKKVILLGVGILLLVTFLVLVGSPAFAEGKRFEGIRIRFFCGGPPGGPFASVVYRGAKAAEEDLGCTVEYVFSDWDPEKMVNQFKEAIASKPDGIAIMGHPGDDALDPLIDQAFEQGIIVTSQNTTLPKAEAKYKARGFGYVGQELYESGYMLGKSAVEMFGLKEGDRAMVWGLLSQPTRGLRTKGVIDALKEKGLVVDYLEISPEVNAEAPLGVPVFTGYVSSHPDVKLVVTDHGALTATMETFFRAAGLGPDDVVGAGFDLSPATLEAIRGGYTDLVLDQQQFLQGYLPVLQLCMSIKYKFSGLHIDTGSGLIHAGNVEEIAPLVEEGIR